MILIICAWIYYFFVILSIGSGALRLLSAFTGADLNGSYHVFYKFWFGLAVLVAILQIISLVLPIHTGAFLIVSVLALIYPVLTSMRIIPRLKSLFPRLRTAKGIVSASMVALLVLVVAYSANREVLHGDTFIYHFNAVKWVREFSVVPGLANLHGRLGFNSSFFLFAALTETGFEAGQSSHIALSMLMTVCLIQWFFIISNTGTSMSKRIFCLLTSLFLVNHTISQIDITSLSTDYPMAILTLVFCVILLDNVRHKVFLLLPIAALIFTFKLSGMLTIAVALLIMCAYAIFQKYDNGSLALKKINKRIAYTSLALLGFIAVGFMARNAFVSGWLVYPFPVGNLHLPWSVPKPYVDDMMQWIKHYPKIPGGVNPATINANDFMYWFPQWYNQFRQSTEFQIFWMSFFILLWSVFQVKRFGRFAYGRLNMMLIAAFGLASIVFWFTSAPEIRFGSIYFFIFFAAAAILLYEGSAHKPVVKYFIFAIFIFQVVGRMPSYVVVSAPRLFSFVYTPPLPLKKVVGSPPGENPPLILYMPAEGDACGNSPLPCTPYAGGYLQNHRLIRQRVPGDISKGFLSIP